jgi:clan AA aspartic protease
MIAGSVKANRDAVVTVELRFGNGSVFNAEAIIDTGFNGYLTLPPSMIDASGFQRGGETRAVLADGTELALELYFASILWDGALRTVTCDVVEGTPMIGMALLDGFRLEIEVKTGGEVTIQPLG